jgi:hypothetical protein
MELIPPRVFGPLSECSRHVLYENALPDATVVLLRTRGANTDHVGTATATNSSGIVALDPSEIFLGSDRVTAYQHNSTGASPWQAEAIEVQRSEGKFSPPQVLTHLYDCSRGFSVGAMRPGTRVEVFHGGTLIGTGIATDGTAHVRISTSSGLPSPGKVLTVRQRVCPMPPPSGGAPEWVFDSQLPPVEPMQSPGGPLGEVPAPVITAGHTACSRSLTVERVIPGAEVIVEDPARGWWASRGPSDATTASLPLPVSLKEGDKLEVRQEFGCRTTSARSTAVVGAQAQLAQLSLFQIDCASSPTVYVRELKAEADVEFEVSHQSITKVYRSVATNIEGPFPAPPMPDGSTVRVRHGECDKWSDWSMPQTAKALARPVSKLRIVGELFECQNAISVENIDPLSGVLVVTSSVTGELARTSYFGNTTTIRVAPSLVLTHDITVEHQVCGQQERDRKHVQALVQPSIGEFEPLFDGDTAVTIRDVTAGAYLEIWDQKERLQTGYAPFSTSGKVNATISGLNPLAFGQHIHAKFWHCGHYGRNEGRPVQLRRPELHSVNPSSVLVPSSDPTAFNLHGRYFRAGAMMWFEGAGFVNTAFQSTTDLLGLVKGHHLVTPRTVKVMARNPDGQTTGLLDVELKAGGAHPPPPPPPPPPSTTGFDDVAVYNCNTDHRDVHVWKRDLTTGGPWTFVETRSHQYDGNWGTCPAPGSDALTIDLVDGHDTAIVVIDPQNVGCIPPGGDPSAADPPATPDTVNASCWRMTAPLIVRGKSGGGTFQFIAS